MMHLITALLTGSICYLFIYDSSFTTVDKLLFLGLVVFINSVPVAIWKYLTGQYENGENKFAALAWFISGDLIFILTSAGVITSAG